MSQPVKLSDKLVLDARIAGEAVERSIAGQVEFWARIGRSVELLLQGKQVLALCQEGSARRISECLESVDSRQGRQRVAVYLESQPFPHYQPHPNEPGLLIRIDADGRRTLGRFFNRQFVPVKAKTKTKAISRATGTRATGTKRTRGGGTGVAKPGVAKPKMNRSNKAVR